MTFPVPTIQASALPSINRVAPGAPYLWQGSTGTTKFANVHGTPAQRFYNVLCIAYGVDQALFADVVSFDPAYLNDDTGALQVFALLEPRSRWRSRCASTSLVGFGGVPWLARAGGGGAAFGRDHQ